MPFAGFVLFGDNPEGAGMEPWENRRIWNVHHAALLQFLAYVGVDYCGIL